MAVFLLLRQPGALLGLIATCSIGFFGFAAVFLQEPGYVVRTRGLKIFAEDSVDAGAVRLWREGIGDSEARLIELADWPDPIRALSPTYVQSGLDRGRYPFTHIIWGDGFGHWGVTIGPEQMPRPSDLGDKYVLPVKPGVFAWHEIQ